MVTRLRLALARARARSAFDDLDRQRARLVRDEPDMVARFDRSYPGGFYVPAFGHTYRVDRFGHATRVR